MKRLPAARRTALALAMTVTAVAAAVALAAARAAPPPAVAATGAGVPAAPAPGAPAPATGGSAPAAKERAADGSRQQGMPFARQVDIAAAGWVRVPLDLAALRHLGPPDSLRITAPDGEDVARWTVPFIAESERRPVKVLSVQQDVQGWTLQLDAGPQPLVHERLLLDLATLGAPPAVTLEASHDGKSWEQLVAGDIFVLSRADGLVRGALPYPASTARYLRLTWPRSAGEPQLTSAVVEPTVPGRSLTVTSPNNPCQPGASTATLACRLPLPAAGQTVRRLTVELAAGTTVGYRLFQPRAGTWQPLAAGVWRGGKAGRHVIQLPGTPLAGDHLRLELATTPSDEAPRLLSHSFDLAVETVLFYAEAPGRYTLSYGGMPAPPAGAGASGSGASGSGQPEARSVAAGVEAAWVPPGPEQPGRPLTLPAAAALGASLSTGRFRASWAVAATGAAAGDLVRLVLPDLVYAQARPDLGDLRLAAGGRQLPYVRWSPPDPVRVVERGEQRPVAEKGRRYSHLDLPLPAAGLPVTEIDLAAPAAPLRRPIGVRYPDPGPPGLTPREERLVARLSWDCLPEPPLPCRLALPLDGPAPRHVAIRFADGDNPPLASVDATVWRRGDVLLFAWPEKGPVRLLAGAPEVTPPAYDLAELADVLPALPAQTAELDPSADAGEPTSPWWSRWALPATLAVAVCGLLALLRRILAEA